MTFELKGETIPGATDHLNLTIREPLGVIAHILAFNHPALFVGWTVSASLAAGNTVIVKPAEQTPLSALYIAELFAEIFPPGVFNVLTGDRNLGPALSAHPEIKKILFIGSIATGKAILKQSSESLRPVTLEMGGKNPLVICPDADIEHAADVAIAGMNFAWCGQSCGSTSRVFIHRDRHDQVLQRIIAKAQTIHPGDPIHAATQMGCLVDHAHRAKVLSYVELGEAAGAHLVLDGREYELPAPLAGGAFLAPCIFSGVTQDMRIAQEEIFGPVMSVMRWDDEQQLLAEINSVQYGLTAAICSPDINRVQRLSRAIQAGYIWVNQAGPHFLAAPFGGQKASGLGRLACLQTLLDCTQLKNINIKFA